MHKINFLIAIAILFAECNPSNSYESETLKIKPVSEHIFRHISYLDTDDFGKVACNGMIYFSKGEAIVFDTPTNNKVSKELIDWIEHDQHKKIKAIVVTHFHGDCMGGLQAFHNRNIESYANIATIELAIQNEEPAIPRVGFEDSFEFRIGAHPVLAAFYGEGHTVDNIVGYVPNENALFGGCIIKSMNASKGYLGDANIGEWSNTVEKVKGEIPDLKIVIPGHGTPGGTELLDYTIQLFGSN